MKYEFVVAQDERGGNFGFRPKHQPKFDPGSSLTVAHDILEHWFKNDFGTANYEIMAFGGALFSRPESIYEKVGAMGFVFGSEIAYQIDEFNRRKLNHQRTGFEGWSFLQEPIREDSRVEKEIDAFMAEMEHQVNRNDGERTLDPGWKVNLHRLPHWIRRGYRLTKNRFSRTTREEVRSAWLFLETEVDKLHRLVDRPEYVGNTLIVNISLKRPTMLELELVEPVEYTI